MKNLLRKYIPYVVICSGIFVAVAIFLLNGKSHIQIVRAQTAVTATSSLSNISFPQSISSTTLAAGIPNDFYFNNDLYLGMNNPDVSYLQYLLDLDDRTVVATSGPGSIGQLTTLFGSKTKDAVKRFQDIYADTILSPVDIVDSTGYFGARSQAQANLIMNYLRYASITPTSTVRVNNSPYQLATSTGVEAGSYSGATGSSDTGTGKTSSGGSSFPGNSQINAWAEQFAQAGLTGGTTMVINQTNQHFSSLLQLGGVKNGTGFSGVPSYFGGAGGGGQGTAVAGAAAGAAAGAVAGMMNFGGKVEMVTQCTCSDFFLLEIADVRGQTTELVYVPGASQLYADYDIESTGVQVLGNYKPGGVCMMESGPSCTQYGSPKGTIQMVGTSATPSP